MTSKTIPTVNRKPYFGLDRIWPEDNQRTEASGIN